MIVISLKQDNNFNAGPKAPKDIKDILKKYYSAKECNICIKFKSNLFDKIVLFIGTLFKFIMLHFKKDVIVYQHPITDRIGITNLIPKKRAIIFIHDVRKIRYPSKSYKDEIKLINSFPYVIAHNYSMKSELIKLGVTSKIYTLELFDYLCNEIDLKKEEMHISYAGNLAKEKSPFIYQIENISLDIYGIGIKEDVSSFIKYKGSVLPEELPNKLCDGFGLVWDGKYDSSDEKEDFKNYTKYNNPHKLSCYLAANLPVIVWNKSAVSKFVINNNIGYAIENLNEMKDLKPTDLMKENAKIIGNRVRSGLYTKEVIDKVLKEMR